MTPKLPPAPVSLWTQTAGAEVATARLADRVTADVAIIGAGYAGLHAALTLAEAGESVIVLDAGPLGYGGSGRNGGVVSAKFRRGFSDIARAHGLEMARRMHAIAERSVDHLIEMIEAHDLQAARFRRVGALKCAHSRKALTEAWAAAEWARTELGDGGLVRLDPDEVAAETGSTGFVGGVLARQGGTVHPLEYLRGLAGAVRAKGVRIFTDSPATRLAESGDRVSISTPDGEVTAKRVVLATDAYSELTPATRPLSRCIVPFRSAMIATEPLPEALDRRLLVEARSYTETRRMMRWFRKVDGRVIFGGRGALGAVDDPAAFRRLGRAMVAIFPDLADIPVEYQWSGHVALTFDALPRAGMVSPRVGVAAGFNGAGVAMAGYVGHGLARQILGHPFDLGLIEREDLRPVPFHAFRAAGVRAVTFGYEMMDAVGL